MYRFQSIIETPVKSNGHWYTIMTGIFPPDDEVDLACIEPEKCKFNFFIMNRNPRYGSYIEGASLDNVKGFLHHAKHNPDTIAKIYDKHKESFPERAVMSLDEVVDEEGIDINDTVVDFRVLPSFEVFIAPRFVTSPMEYSLKQTGGRLEPFFRLRSALKLNGLDESEINKAWTDRNGALNRLAHPMKGEDDPSYFSPIHYCPEGKHYWEWFRIGKDKTLKVFVRHAYLVNDDPGNYRSIPQKTGPDEYKNIPQLSCPHHFPNQEEESGNYVTRTIPVSNRWGIHARPSAEIALFANRYDGDVAIESENFRADARSIMDNMQLYALKGSTLKVTMEKVPSKEMFEEVFKGIYHAANNELH